MSHKFKLEEFHDPDYNLHQYSKTEHQVKKQQHLKSETSQNQSKPTDKHETLDQPCASTAKTKDQRHKKICDIIKREFNREITAKKSEIDEITKRINEAKELLAKVRYTVVYNYYSKKNLSYSESEFKEILNSAAKNNTMDGDLSGVVDTSEMDLEKFQPAIHPSLKKLFGQRKVDYDEILKARPRRQAAKTATQRFNKKGKHVKLKVDQQSQGNKNDDAVTLQNTIVSKSDSSCSSQSNLGFGSFFIL